MILNKALTLYLQLHKSKVSSLVKSVHPLFAGSFSAYINPLLPEAFLKVCQQMALGKTPTDKMSLTEVNST
ncbi:unnamed protein product [Ixodes pacificus]